MKKKKKKKNDRIEAVGWPEWRRLLVSASVPLAVLRRLEPDYTEEEQQDAAELLEAIITSAVDIADHFHIRVRMQVEEANPESS
jgi:hypothetical protein